MRLPRGGGENRAASYFLRPSRRLGRPLGLLGLRIAAQPPEPASERHRQSALLVATFAAAVYANHLWLIPRLWRRRRFDAAYAAALLLVMGLLALACTAAIHVAYDVLWGPDPARFGFLINFGMEFALVAFHVLVVAVGV